MKQYFENKLPSIYRVPTVKWLSEKGFSLNHKSFKTMEEAEKYNETRLERIGAFEITHTYGNKDSLVTNHFYRYRGFSITCFDKDPGTKLQYHMVDEDAYDNGCEYHGHRESLALALDYIDSYLYKVQIGKIKVKRSKKKKTAKNPNKKYVIIHTDHNGTCYLAWQKPAWDESGYFWTDRKTFMETLCNSTMEHPFLFNSQREACTWLRLSGIDLRCKITTIKINKKTKLNDPVESTFPGIAV